MRKREREQWMGLLEKEREAHRKERQELLNRIAQPQVHVLDAPAEVPDIEPPRDALELAYIGQEVPDGISVGAVRDNESA